MSSLLPLLLTLSCCHWGSDAVTLSAGSHLDLSVVVVVDKNYTGDKCQRAMLSWEGEARNDTSEHGCLWRKCVQQLRYKVDLGYSKVRMGVDGLPYEYPRGIGREQFVREKNQVSRILAERIRRLNNDAFQPFLFHEFAKLIAHFYDGHSRILALFNLSMADLVMERLSLGNFSTRRLAETSLCAKQLPRFAHFEKKLLALLENNWQFDWNRHNDTVTDITFFEAIKYRIPPSPIPMIEAYNLEATTKRQLIDHTNQLFRLLVDLWSDFSTNKAKLGRECLEMMAEIEQIIKSEPLVARVAYSPVRSVLVRNLEVILRSKISLTNRFWRYSPDCF